MTETETLKILAVLRGAYPRFYSGLSEADLDATVSLWAEMFDEPYTIVSAAVKALVTTDTKGFPPSVGQVKEKIRLLSAKEGMTELEAWGLVSKALKNGIYGYKKEFAKLPPIIQETLGDASQLRDWAMLDESEVQSVIASNFQRSFRTRSKRAEEIKALPADVRAVAEQLAAESAMGLLED